MVGRLGTFLENYMYNTCHCSWKQAIIINYHCSGKQTIIISFLHIYAVWSGSALFALIYWVISDQDPTTVVLADLDIHWLHRHKNLYLWGEGLCPLLLNSCSIVLDLLTIWKTLSWSSKEWIASWVLLIFYFSIILIPGTFTCHFLNECHNFIISLHCYSILFVFKDNNTHNLNWTFFWYH
jgi:hypothetical protein